MRCGAAAVSISLFVDIVIKEGLGEFLSSRAPAASCPCSPSLFPPGSGQNTGQMDWLAAFGSFPLLLLHPAPQRFASLLLGLAPYPSRPFTPLRCSSPLHDDPLFIPYATLHYPSCAPIVVPYPLPLAPPFDLSFSVPRASPILCICICISSYIYIYVCVCVFVYISVFLFLYKLPHRLPSRLRQNSSQNEPLTLEENVYTKSTFSLDQRKIEEMENRNDLTILLAYLVAFSDNNIVKKIVKKVKSV